MYIALYCLLYLYSKPQKKRPTNPEEGESKGEVDPQHPSGPSLEDEWISDSEQVLDYFQSLVVYSSLL